jgi:hypothetical protein
VYPIICCFLACLQGLSIKTAGANRLGREPGSFLDILGWGIIRLPIVLYAIAMEHLSLATGLFWVVTSIESDCRMEVPVFVQSSTEKVKEDGNSSTILRVNLECRGGMKESTRAKESKPLSSSSWLNAAAVVLFVGMILSIICATAGVECLVHTTLILATMLPKDHKMLFLISGLCISLAIKFMIRTSNEEQTEVVLQQEECSFWLRPNEPILPALRRHLAAGGAAGAGALPALAVSFQGKVVRGRCTLKHLGIQRDARCVLQSLPLLGLLGGGVRPVSCPFLLGCPYPPTLLNQTPL